MERKIFQEFRDLIYEKSGITLKEGKEALLSARLGRRLKELGLKDLKEYLLFIKKDDNDNEIVNLLNVISTNVTSFFREDAHFKFLEQTLISWKKQDQRKIRIWSVACSSGEEPYSMAMTGFSALDLSAKQDIDLKILATDISTRVLEKAMKGTYSKQLLKDIPAQFRGPEYLSESKSDPTQFEISKKLKNLVSFGRLNLSAPPFPMRGPFDVVFCRNVMIYFDQAVRERLVNEMKRLLKPGGFLLIGHSETLTKISNGLKIINPSIYQKESC